MSQTFLILRIADRDISINVQFFIERTRHSCHILIKLEFSGQIVEKYSNIKFHENPSSECRDGKTDRRTDMMKLIVAFRNFANALKKNFPLSVKCVKETSLMY